MTEPCIQTNGLTRTFGELLAVDHIDLEVPRGCFYGFLGPNGAGKSTTIKMLTGLLRPTGGSARVLGWDVEKDLLEIQRRTGVVPETLNLFERLTGLEYLEFVGRIYRLSPATIRSRSDELLGLMDLEEKANVMVVDYSHGMKKKIALAAALIHDPELYFLDEPFEGIDAVTSKQIRDVLLSLVERRATVFLTSHILEIVDRLCTHVAIIRQGAIVSQGAKGELGREGETMEEVFLRLLGGEAGAVRLSWIE